MVSFKITDYGKGAKFIEDDVGSVICAFPDYCIDRDENIQKICDALNSGAAKVTISVK